MQNNIIPFIHVNRKHLDKISIPLLLEELYDLDYFKNLINKELLIDNTYSVSIKLRYDNDNIIMVGANFGFIYNDNDYINDLQENCNIRLEDSFSMYNINSESIVYIEIIFRKIDKVLLKEYSLDNLKDKSKNTYNIINNNINIPFSMNLGKPLEMILDDKGFAKGL